MGVGGIFTFLSEHAELSGAMEFDVPLVDLADQHYQALGDPVHQKVMVIDAWNFLHSVARKNLRLNPFYGGQPRALEHLLKGRLKGRNTRGPNDKNLFLNACRVLK